MSENLTNADILKAVRELAASEGREYASLSLAEREELKAQALDWFATQDRRWAAQDAWAMESDHQEALEIHIRRDLEDSLLEDLTMNQALAFEADGTLPEEGLTDAGRDAIRRAYARRPACPWKKFPTDTRCSRWSGHPGGCNFGAVRPTMAADPYCRYHATAAPHGCPTVEVDGRTVTRIDVTTGMDPLVPRPTRLVTDDLTITPCEPGTGPAPEVPVSYPAPMVLATILKMVQSGRPVFVGVNTRADLELEGRSDWLTKIPGIDLWVASDVAKAFIREYVLSSFAK